MSHNCAECDCDRSRSAVTPGGVGCGWIFLTIWLWWKWSYCPGLIHKTLRRKTPPHTTLDHRTHPEASFRAPEKIINHHRMIQLEGLAHVTCVLAGHCVGESCWKINFVIVSKNSGPNKNDHLLEFCRVGNFLYFSMSLLDPHSLHKLIFLTLRLV